MEVVINIPDELYETIKSDKYGVHQGRIYDIIRNGIILSKGYDKLINTKDEDCLYEAFDLAIKALEQKPKIGHWIYTLEDWNKWECSECGFTKRTDIHVDIGYKYCPKCGARMENK